MRTLSWVRRRATRLAALGALCLTFGTVEAFAQDPVRWSIARAEREGAGARRPSPTVTAGGTFEIRVDATIEDGWHVYATSQPAGGPVPLKIDIPRGGPFSLAGAIDEPLPQREFDPNFQLDTLFHKERAVFGVPVRVAANTPSRGHRLRVVVSYQTCNDRLCLPPKDEELGLEISVGATAGPPGPTGPAGPTEPTVGADGAKGPEGPRPAGAGGPEGPRAPVRDLATTGAGTFGAYLWLAAAMGALSLLTPCVFPMVPITVSYFTRRVTAGPVARADSVVQALVYGAGIILTFTAVGFTLAVAFGAAGLNRFAADPWLNLAVTALFVAFALSLFGVYELTLPSRLLTFAAKADQG
ncbi:MAG: protein-disulfide reductase DsbD domain-containing protein, partial [Acidobacteriota bacterium]